MMVYAVLYNPMYEESATETLSLHETLKGAYRAMRNHKEKIFNESREDMLRFGKKDSWFRWGKWDKWQWWDICKREVTA